MFTADVNFEGSVAWLEKHVLGATTQNMYNTPIRRRAIPMIRMWIFSTATKRFDQFKSYSRYYEKLKVRKRAKFDLKKLLTDTNVTGDQREILIVRTLCTSIDSNELFSGCQRTNFTWNKASQQFVCPQYRLWTRTSSAVQRVALVHSSAVPHRCGNSHVADGMPRASTQKSCCWLYGNPAPATYPDTNVCNMCCIECVSIQIQESTSYCGRDFVSIHTHTREFSKRRHCVCCFPGTHVCSKIGR